MAGNDHLTIGERSDVSHSRFGRWVDVGAQSTLLNATIGDFSYIGPRATIAFVTIGSFCSIASDVVIGSGSHPSRATVSTHPAFYLHRPERGWSFVQSDGRHEFQATCVGHDVWIGAKATIRDGLTVGSGVIIGAGAVVVKDLEPYGVYAGVPARLVRKRFSDDAIEQLLAFEWWHKPVDWLANNAGLFSDPEKFLSSVRVSSDHAVSNLRTTDEDDLRALF